MVNDVVAALRVLDVEERLGALVSVVEGEDVGAVAVVDAEDGYVAGSMPALVADDVLADANVLMATETSQTIAYDTSRVLIDVVAPRPVMLIFGAGHVAQPLSKVAHELGFRTVVADARAAWATPDRFPEVDEVIAKWPDGVFDHIGLDNRTYVVLLSHDVRFEVPVLAAVRGTAVRYIGAIGSRRTHRLRSERLAAEGWSDEEIASIHAPIGLDLGGSSPAEIAVAIAAEVVRVRYGEDSRATLRGAVST